MTNHNTNIAKAVFAIHDTSLKIQALKYVATLTPEEVKIEEIDARPEEPLTHRVGALRQYYDNHFDGETVKVEIDLSPSAKTSIVLTVDGEEHHFKY
tara:strand:- start:6250 stop:6540 length:291 start_codon:yes stop_codon:yes gene_type:complete